ncbi:sulfurtransferase [Streptomyces sp. NPDC088254]|uniref:sulfurtransferase n=1 Tax=Streptomyces sp. NPDC088254 TaxID=3365847 RepID=UPI0038263CC7
MTAFETVPVLTTPAELDSLLCGGDPAPVVLDVRWRLGDPEGREHYLKEHIPGALYVDLDTELSAPATPEGGRHPLPDPASLQAAARRWGLSAGRTVVVYDDNGNTAAARAWWLLRWAGIEHVRLLDGALDAWRSAGLPTANGEPSASATAAPMRNPMAARRPDAAMACGSSPVPVRSTARRTTSTGEASTDSGSMPVVLARNQTSSMRRRHRTATSCSPRGSCPCWTPTRRPM